MAEQLVYTVPESADGERLDKALAAGIAQLSRSRLKALIEAGDVALVKGGVHATLSDPSRTVKSGERIRVSLPAPEDPVPKAQSLPLAVVYEDDALIVVDKPAGLVVHPAPGNPDNTLVNALIAHCGESLSGIGGVRRPGIVHRIDKDTSGLLVAAKNDAAHAGLAEQFARHSIDRVYLAVTKGCPAPPAGRITGAIGRNPKNRKKMAIVARGGKPAVTRYTTRERFSLGGRPFAALVACRLETGRTHQVRVHLASLGTPLIGDPLYGRALKLPKDAPEELAHTIASFGRQALHAHRLGFDHPASGERLDFESALPDDMAEIVRLLRAA